jgi:hypothetical protein
MKSLSGKLGVIIFIIDLSIFSYAEVWGAEPTPQSRINFEPLIYALFGWVLGVFGTLLVERLKRRQVKADFMKNVSAQFKEIVPRLAGNYLLLKINLGEMDRDALNWIKNVRSQGYKFLEDKTVEAINKFLEMSDEQIRAVNQLTKQKPTKASFIKKFSLPLLTENISSISLLESNLQHSLLDIRTKISWLNEMVERHNFYFEKTFDSGISSENREIIDSNIRDGYTEFGNWCRKLSELIMNSLKELPNTK